MAGTSTAASRSAMLMTGMVVLLVAVAGLSAFQARTHPGAIWVAFAVTAIGTVAFFAGYVGVGRDRRRVLGSVVPRRS